MRRLRIWDVDPALLHIVLHLSFDPRELVNTATSAQLELTPQPLESLPLAALHALVDACAHDSPAARLMERHLDLIHAFPAQGLSGDRVEPILLDLLAADLDPLEDLPRNLWYTATHPYASCPHIAQRLCAALTNAALTSLRDRHLTPSE